MYDKTKLNKWSGNDATIRIKFTPSVIKFNGSKGTFTLIAKNAEGYDAPVAMTAPFTVTILRPRRICGWYEKEGGKSISYFTNEHNSYEDQITLFSSEKGDKAKVIDTGTSGSLYEKYPLLRISAVLYVLYNNEVHKLRLKGKSLKAFKTYREDLAKDNKTFYEFETEVNSKKEVSDTFDYYSATLTATKPTDLEIIGPFIESVGTTLDKIDEQHKKASVEAQEKSDPGSTQHRYTEPVINIDDEDEPATLETDNSE
ncbi:MAG: hypothetical protein KKF08_19130, partial [Gammaproteobacteria bacterium]|nr:hypothetical protein [Gammaproteobacteria bacterium]